MDKLISIINSVVQLSEKEWSLIKNSINLIHLNKGDLFVGNATICNKMGFVQKGIARVYYIAEGKEYTSYFNTQERNQIICAFSSFISRKPSYEIIQAITDCEIFIISYEALQNLYETSASFQKLGRLTVEQNYVASIRRIYDYQHKSARDRYIDLLKKYHSSVNFIPQHYIASYLGITPESLSRLRKQLVSKGTKK